MHDETQETDASGVTVSADAVPVPAKRKSDWRVNLWVAGCTTVANLAAYGFNLVLAKPLGKAHFGELSALLAIYLIIQVPGTAMQALVARRIATMSDGGSHSVRSVVTDSIGIGAVVGVLVMALSPAMHTFLHVQSWWSLFSLALIAIPTTLSFAVIGILQGQQRFVALGVVVLNVQLARVLAAVIAAKTTANVASAMAWSVACVLVVTAIAVAKVLIDNPEASSRMPNLIRTLARDCASVLVVLVLTNIDILLAQHYLSRDEASEYGAGALVTKMAFWAPAFIATVSFPRLSRPSERHGALRRSAFICGALTVVVVVGAAVMGPFAANILSKISDADYKPVGGILWLFALQGAALAALLLGVYAAIAVHDRRLTWIAWGVFIAEGLTIATVAHGSVLQILCTVSTGSISLMLIAVAMERKILFSTEATVEAIGFSEP